MGEELGMSAFLGFGEETVYGTEVAASEYVRITGESLSYNKPVKFNPSLGQIYKRQPFDGKKTAGGDTVHALMFEGFNTLYKHAFGSKTTVAGTGFGTHTFKVAEALPIVLTLHMVRDTYVWKYRGCRVRAIEFKIESGELVEVTITWKGKNVTTAAAGSATYPTDSDVTDVMGTITLDAVDVSTDIKSGRIKFENPFNEDMYPAVDNEIRSLPRNDLVVVSGEILPWLDGLTMWNKFANSTKCALTLDYTGGNIPGSSPATNHQWTLRIGALKFHPTADPNVDGPDVIDIPMPFEGYVYNPAATNPYEPIELKVVNSATT